MPTNFQQWQHAISTGTSLPDMVSPPPVPVFHDDDLDDDIEIDTGATLEAPHSTQDEESKPIKPMLSADVEFFLKDAAGTFVPVTGLAKGTKGAPIWLDKYTGILEDNVALELNMPPSSTSDSFSRTVGYASSKLRTWAKENGVALKYGNCQEITYDAIKNNPTLTDFGCSPDYLAYGENPDYPRKPVTAKSLGLMRYAAGHLHISYDTSIVPPYVLARWLDAVIGIDSVWWDVQKGRRDVYGLAGLFRPTTYPNGSTGVEYRTLSNLWFFDGNLPIYLSGAVFSILQMIKHDTAAAKDQYAKIPWSDVRSAINNADTKEAMNIWNYMRRNSKMIANAQDYFNTPGGNTLTYAVEA